MIILQVYHTLILSYGIVIGSEKKPRQLFENEVPKIEKEIMRHHFIAEKAIAEKWNDTNFVITITPS